MTVKRMIELLENERLKAMADGYEDSEIEIAIYMGSCGDTDNYNNSPNVNYEDWGAPMIVIQGGLRK